MPYVIRPPAGVGRWIRGAVLGAAAVFVGAPLVATPLVAQSSSTATSAASVDLFAARKETSSSPLFGGASVSLFRGPVGLRFGGGLNFRDGNEGTSRYTDRYVDPRFCQRPGHCIDRVRYLGQGADGPMVNAWAADADLLVEPLREATPLRALLLGFSPYAFAGIGRYETGTNSFADTSLTTWSYGAGVHHVLLGAASLGAEARFRQPLQQSVAPRDVARRSWEYRASLSFTVGGRGRRAPSLVGAPACASCVSQPDAAADAAPVDAGAEDARVAARVLDAADGYVGAPYRAGGASPSTGFDAAGFVQYVYGQEGVRLPRTARDMAGVGTEVSTKVGALRPGDLLFFANDGVHVDHVAIYAGHERIVHASASGEGVRYDDLADGERGRWFADHLVAARRVTGLRQGGVDDRRDGEADRAPRANRRPL